MVHGTGPREEAFFPAARISQTTDAAQTPGVTLDLWWVKW